ADVAGGGLPRPRCQEIIRAPCLDQIFGARLGAVGAVAVVDEDAPHRIGDFRRLARPHHYAGFMPKGPVSGDAAEEQPEPDSRLDAEAVLDLDGLKADVVGIFEHRNDTGAVEADVELARDAVKRAVVEDVEVPFA